MLTYLPLSSENINEATKLVRSVFLDDFNGQEGIDAYKSSLNKEKYKSYFDSHYLETLEYFVVKNSSSENIIGVTVLYTRNIDSQDIIWLGWYCLSEQERGKGFGREILEWTMNKAREKGYTKMKLYTSTDPNEATAQILYEKLGFKVVDEELKEGEVYKTLYRECIL